MLNINAMHNYLLSQSLNITLYGKQNVEFLPQADMGTKRVQYRENQWSLITSVFVEWRNRNPGRNARVVSGILIPVLFLLHRWGKGGVHICKVVNGYLTWGN